MNTYLIYDSANQAHEVQADYLQHEEDGFVAFLRWGNPQAKSDAEYVASFCKPVSVVLKEAEKPEVSKRVSVYMEGQGLPLFHGTSAVSSYEGWHRVIPESGYIDLPPRFKVVPR